LAKKSTASRDTKIAEFALPDYKPPDDFDQPPDLKAIDPKPSDRQLFESVGLGMNRAEAERILGKPAHETPTHVYYGGSPKIKEWESPQAPFSIKIIYSRDNIVASKQFFGRDR